MTNMLNKLHFDFRNAQPAFLGISYSKLDDPGVKPDVGPEQPELSFVDSTGIKQVERNAVKRAAEVHGADDSEILQCETGLPVNGSAVQVDDGDSVCLPVVSAAAVIQLHSSSKLHEPESAFSSFGLEHDTQSGKMKKTSPPISASSSSSFAQANKSADFVHNKEQDSKLKWTENNITDNETTALPNSTEKQIGLLSVHANKTYLLRERVKLEPGSTDQNTEELSDGCRQSESRITSASSSLELHDDDLDYTPKRKRKRKGGTQHARCVKKAARTKTAMKVAGIKTELSVTECKHKPKLMHTPRRRQRMKSDLEDNVWSSHKKLLMTPINKKLSKSGRKGICASTCKRKRCKSARIEGIEMLPDLGVKLLESDGTNLTEVLKTSSWQSDVGNSTSAENVPRKWHIDVTGADLMTDLDTNYGRSTQRPSTDKQKYRADGKAIEQSVGQLKYAAAADCCHPTITTSQETPPPSVASDSISSCNDLDQSTRSGPEEEAEFYDSRWLNFDTKLAHYIDGRRFNRLVNGISVKVSATLSDKALGQVGQEYVGLPELTKREIKQLQDQVRLEEVYCRRARKSMLSASALSHSNRRAGSRSSRQHTGSDRVPRSRAKSVAKLQRTGDSGNESAQASANQLRSSFAVDTELCQPDADLDNDMEPCLSSDDVVVQSNNTISKLDGTSEPSSGISAGTSHEAGHSLASIDGADQHESACVSVLVRIRRSIAAVKNKSRMTSVGLTSSQSNVDSDAGAESDFLVPDNALSCHKSTNNADSLDRRINSLNPADDNPTTVVTQHGTVNAVTSISYPDTSRTCDSEYIAAVALASLSVAPESQLRSTCLFESHTEAAANQCQTEEESQSAQRDSNYVEIISKPTYDYSPQHPMDLSCTKTSSGKTVTTASLVKSSDQSVEISRHHSKDGTKDRHVSTDRHHGHFNTQKSASSVVSESKKISSESCRLHGKSHFTVASGRMKQVSEGKERSSATYSSNSSKCNDNGSSHVAASSVSIKNPEMSSTASDIASRNDGHAAKDKTRRRNHRSGSHQHSGGNRESGRPEKKQVESGECVDGTITVASADSNNDSNSMLCNSSSDCALATVVSPQSTLPILSSQNIVHFDGTVNYSGTEAKISLNLQEMPVNLTSSLPTENLHLMSGTEAGSAATVHESYSSMNSNNTLKQSSIVFGANSERSIDADVSGIMPGTDVLNAIAATDELPDNCSVARSNEISAHSEVPNPLQLPTTLADFSPESPTSPYRELEEIRSPSPMPFDMEREDSAREIRSPSPCDIVFPAAVFHVVETSWDVKPSSPCEIQSPDVSEDEAEETAEQLSRHCNVCSQHGPLTIPLTAEETTGHTRKHQLDMT